MRSAIAPVSAVLLSVAILLMGNGLQGTLLPVRAGIENFSALSIGILGSSYFFGFGAGCLIGPLLVRRAGHIRTFTAMVAIASTTALIHAVLLVPAIWWIARGATGFCFAVLYMVIESWLNEKATNKTRGAVFSVYTIINLTVITIGQLILTIVSPESFALFALASILVSLAAVPVAMTTAEAPAPILTVKVRLAHLWRISPVGFAGAIAVGLANGSFWALAPLFGQRTGMGTGAIAIFMSVCVLAGAIGQWPFGKLSDHTDRRIVIVLACTIAALAGVALVLTGLYWPRALLAAGFLFGTAAFPLYSLAAAHMNDHVEANGFVEASSGLLLVFAGGAVIGPMLASSLMRVISPDALFGYTATIHVLMAIFTLYRMRLRPKVTEEERQPFTESIIMAQTLSNVDPMLDGADGADDPPPPSQPPVPPGKPGPSSPPPKGPDRPNPAG